MVCVDGCTSVKHDHIFMGKALKINKMQKKKQREREEELCGETENSNP
jgi:hypothetical protein